MPNLGSFEFQGMDALNAAMRSSPGRAVVALGGALYREGHRIMAVSKREVPVRFGILRASGNVELPRFEGLGVEVALGYGGSAQSYAVIQHENLTYRHHGDQKAHYLSDPMEAAAAGMDERLAADIEPVDLFPGLPG